MERGLAQPLYRLEQLKTHIRDDLRARLAPEVAAEVCETAVFAPRDYSFEYMHGMTLRAKSFEVERFYNEVKKGYTGIADRYSIHMRASIIEDLSLLALAAERPQIVNPEEFRQGQLKMLFQKETPPNM